MLSHHEQELFTKAFLQCYRTASWSVVVASTVRQASSHVASTFWGNLRDSPLHIPNGAHLRPFVCSLLKAFENEDPPKYQQRAITPNLLRSMFTRAGADDALTKDTFFAILADLAIMAYFFAMRSCEFTATPLPGRTKIIHLRGIVFRDRLNNEVDHKSPFLHLSERVTLSPLPRPTTCLPSGTHLPTNRSRLV